MFLVISDHKSGAPNDGFLPNALKHYFPKILADTFCTQKEIFLPNRYFTETIRWVSLISQTKWKVK